MPDLSNSNENTAETLCGYPSSVENALDVLRKATRVILNQQKAVEEEQRFHAVFQMLSIILHELNQPLTSILGNLELMPFYRDKPGKLTESINRVEEAGKRLSSIIKKIQELRNEARESQVIPFELATTKREFKVMTLVDSDSCFSSITSAFHGHGNIALHRVKSPEEAFEAMNREASHLVMISGGAIRGTEFLHRLKACFPHVPVIYIAGEKDEIMAFTAIREGAENYVFEWEMNRETLVKKINHAMETAFSRRKLHSILDKMADISAHDDLTDLFQARYFRDGLDREIIRAKRDDRSFYVCKVQLDEGDRTLKNMDRGAMDDAILKVSKLLREYLGGKNLLCRYENAAFAFIVQDDGLNSPAQIRKDLAVPLEGGTTESFSPEIAVPISMGISRFVPEKSCSAIDLLKEAWKSPVRLGECRLSSADSQMLPGGGLPDCRMAS
jgi:diguanylate cyclase (GGDEF)-like protein